MVIKISLGGKSAGWGWGGGGGDQHVEPTCSSGVIYGLQIAEIIIIPVADLCGSMYTLNGSSRHCVQCSKCYVAEDAIFGEMRTFCQHS